ncbi:MULTISPECIES: hypothetical protein [unclassified Arcicella]|jgi:hypothetical protein|uniref:hypothetical protein n=1 Tax=unclassified Arcicella TaxID=2644986 RepID=UPI002861B166|nr:MULTISPECIES: hypothetical protein [unclassified Arcicella]MCA6439598.1 hypothetical protein [Chitinophagaceae bacterium]MCA6447559.1 hypothetical protein [Chitinophagaceae bacterium]MDR6561497.1 hypothetical protein [Arcicella sp. BE51]MDR6811380.1 hypothetical protein [Arcicella sp. BE140]MDR6822731.1 hypothetical protein [Arcicella sp. BE139]
MNKLLIGAFASIAIFLASCGSDTKTAKDAHTDGDGHNHATEQVAGKPAGKAATKDRNEKGQLIDSKGQLITGCPGHKEMIGSQGDKCPKCEYMTMIPITWDITGVDTVRVTTLADYNPPANKMKK